MNSYYKIYKNDVKKATGCMAKLEKMIDTHFVKAEAVLELEIARKIDNI